MFCQKCGTQNPDDGKFCSKCGNNLKSEKPETKRTGIAGRLGKAVLAGIIVFFIVTMILQSNNGTNAPTTQQIQNSKATELTAKIGNRVIAGDFAYTFNSMTTSKEIGENTYGTFVGKKADGVFIILDVTIENIEKESKTILIGSMIKIKDDQGRKYSSDAMAGIYLKEEAFTFTQLQPGLPKRGKIVFDVPENINGQIEVASGLFLTNYKYVSLNKFESKNNSINALTTQQTQNKNVPESTAKMGDKVIEGDFAYTFHSMDTGTSIGEDYYGTFVGDKADGMFIVFDVTIENIGKESQTMLIDSYIKIIDDQGRTFNHDAMAEIYLKEEAFSFTQLQPSLPKRGKIVFDIPKNINSKIELSTGLWSSDKKYVLLTTEPASSTQVKTAGLATEFIAESDKLIPVKLRSVFIGIGQKDKAEFFPSNVKINSGATIVWRNEDVANERRFTLISSDGLFPDIVIGYLKKYSYQFNTTGTYQFSIKEFPEATA